MTRLARIGQWSYSTYLIHIPIFCVVVGGANVLFGQRSQMEYVVLLIVCFPLTLIVSKYLFEHVEKRFNRHGRAVAEEATSRRRAGRPPSACRAMRADASPWQIAA